MKDENKKGKKEINMSFTVLKNCGFHNLDIKFIEHMKRGGRGEEFGRGSRVTVPNGNSSPGSSRISIWRRREPQNTTNSTKAICFELGTHMSKS